MGHQDVMDKKIRPDDLNLKGTGIIHKGRGEMSENAGPLPHTSLKVYAAGKNERRPCTGQDQT